MAVQIETQGQLSEFLEILSRRRWQLALPALVVLALGAALAVLIPKKYLVSTQVEVRTISVTSASGKEAENAPNQIRANERIRKVLESLKEPAYLARNVKGRNEFVDDVRDDLKVRVDKASGATSSFVTIEYLNVDVRPAMEFLKALREDWKQDVLDRERNRADDDASRAREAVNALEIELKQEEDKLSKLQQDNEISATQPLPGGRDTRNEDPEFEALTLSKAQLATCELKLDGAEKRVTNLETRLSDTPPKLSEEQLIEGVNTSAEILAIQKEIDQQYAELARYRPTHTRYGQILEEIDRLEKQRDAIKKQATRTELTSLSKPNPMYSQLQEMLHNARLERDQLAGEKALLEKTIKANSENVERLYPVIKQIRLHGDRVQRLSKELEVATIRRDEKVALASAFGSRLNDPFSITADVSEPEKPTEPNPWLIVAFALVAGLTLGLALALTAEYGRNCFRSVHDISRVMVAPVLGNIGGIRTSRQLRLRRVRRALVGAFSAGVIGALLFLTWAWARNRDLLSPQLQVRIEQLRDKLR